MVKGIRGRRLPSFLPTHPCLICGADFDKKGRPRETYLEDASIFKCLHWIGDRCTAGRFASSSRTPAVELCIKGEAGGSFFDSGLFRDPLQAQCLPSICVLDLRHGSVVTNAQLHLLSRLTGLQELHLDGPSSFMLETQLL
ncbi:hypothetical protein WJX72_006930 [[Myrmecia] bisecta]|uniref:Uncharacterized protein n=1 Tax=[Myrmecia] bisecta TaxID=41462 RepID=A0AAW1R8E7_9CHLO